MQTDVTKPELTPVPIWRCRSETCKAWVREELTQTASPTCPLCHGGMIRSIKHLPKLAKKHKAPKNKSSQPSVLH